MRWMLAAPRATAPPWNLPKITPGTKAPFCSAPKKYKLCFLIVSNKLKPQRDRVGTTKRIGTIKIVAIAASAPLGLRALPRPLGSAQPRSRLEMIVAATSQRIGKIGTWAGPPVTIVTWKAILPTNALSPVSQKISISLGDLRVGEWC